MKAFCDESERPSSCLLMLLILVNDVIIAREGGKAAAIVYVLGHLRTTKCYPRFSQR